MQEREKEVSPCHWSTWRVASGCRLHFFSLPVEASKGMSDVTDLSLQVYSAASGDKGAASFLSVFRSGGPTLRRTASR